MMGLKAKLPLTPEQMPLVELFFACSKENDCGKCPVKKACQKLHDRYLAKEIDLWEANRILLALRKTAVTRRDLTNAG